MFVVWSVSPWPNSFRNQRLLKRPGIKRLPRPNTWNRLGRTAPLSRAALCLRVCVCLPFCLRTGADFSLKPRSLAYFPEHIRLLILLVFERRLTFLSVHAGCLSWKMFPRVRTRLSSPGVSRPWRLAWLLSAG